MFDSPTRIINCDKITSHWGKTNIHRYLDGLVLYNLYSLVQLICKSLCVVIIKQIVPDQR